MVKELDIPSVRVDEVIDLTAGFFVRNVKIELEYPHLFSSSLDKPTWEPLFNFLNLMDTSTTITKAELIANDGDIQSTDDNLNIELNIGMAQRSNIIFPLSKSIPELKNIDGIIRFSHSHGEITLNVNYDLENALFEREDK